jgi:hypothetical protein
MNTFLETVKLRGTENMTLGVPAAGIEGELLARDTELVFRSNHGRFDLAIPWTSIKACYPYPQPGSAFKDFLVGLLARAETANTNWFIHLTYVNAERGADVTVVFYLGNTFDNLLAEKKATALVNAIGTIRTAMLETGKSQ